MPYDWLKIARVFRSRHRRKGQKDDVRPTIEITHGVSPENIRMRWPEGRAAMLRW